MGTAFNSLLAVIVAVVHFGLGLVDPPTPPLAPPFLAVVEPVPARIEFVDVSDEFVAAALWGVSLFERAELPLPPLRFVGYGDDRTRCGEYRAVHHVDGQRSIIGLCTTELDMVVEALILHELSHAWAAFHLTEARQAEFRALRGYEHWRNHAEAEWSENGSEQAAEIMVWGLIDRPIAVFRLRDNSCDELEAGFRTLTGAAPLHGYRDHC